MTASSSYNYNGQGLQLIGNIVDNNGGLYGIGGIVNAPCVLKFYLTYGFSNGSPLSVPLIGQPSAIVTGNPNNVVSGSISSIFYASNLETVTLSAAHGLTIGSKYSCVISGLVTTGTNAGTYNITVIITPTTTTAFTFPVAATLGTYGSGGTVSITGNTIPIQKVPIQANNVIEEQYTESVSLVNGSSLWCCLQQYFDDNHLIRWSTAQYNYASISPSNTINGLTLAQYTAQGGLPPTILQLSPSSPGDPGDPVILNYAANITIRYAS